MVILFVITSAAAWLLMGAGVAKLLRPSGTANAIRQLLPVGGATGLARGLGLVEVLAASAFLLRPGFWAGFAIAVVYLALLVAALTLRARDTECGCFGSVGGRITQGHITTTAVLAAAGFTTALTASDPVGSTNHYFLSLASIPASILLYAVLVPLAELHESMRQFRS